MYLYASYICIHNNTKYTKKRKKKVGLTLVIFEPKQHHIYIYIYIKKNSYERVLKADPTMGAPAQEQGSKIAAVTSSLATAKPKDKDDDEAVSAGKGTKDAEVAGKKSASSKKAVESRPSSSQSKRRSARPQS
jgi:hypothetical protein